MASKFRFNFDLSSMQKNAQLKKDFEEFKKTDIGKESLEKLDLSPEAAYSEYTNRTKFIESASKLQAGNLKSQKANIFNKLLPELAETNGGIIPTGQMNGIVPTNQGGINQPPGMIQPPTDVTSKIGMTGFDVTPTGGTLKYGQTPESKYKFDVMKNIKTKNIDMRSKLEMTRLSNTYNLNLVGATARDASDLLVEGYLEGGAGDKYKSIKTWAAAKGLLGEAGNNYDAAGTYMGKRGELILKMFPMFTQQLGKEGSIRLIVSVLDLIGVTIPDLHTPEKMARRQYEGTLNSLYEVRRTLDSINLDEYDLTKPGSKKDFQESVREETSKLRLTPEDTELRSAFVSESLSGLDEYLRNKELLEKYVKDPRNKGISREKIYRRLQEKGALK